MSCDSVAVIDWNDAFENSGYIAGAEHLPARWAAVAAAFRQDQADHNRAELDLAYGDDAREVMDLFHPATPGGAGIVIFVHGGYWHLLDKSYWSHMARGCSLNGLPMAVVSYPLAPTAAIADITRSVAKAVAALAQRFDGPVRLIGHSAGGHLVARMACRDVLSPAVAARLAKVVSVSGLHDLRPLTATDMNQILRLDAMQACQESPALQAPITHCPITFWVGAQERPEFLRQSRLAEEKWQAAGGDVRTIYEPGHHHFSVIESLTLIDGALTKELLQ